LIEIRKNLLLEVARYILREQMLVIDIPKKAEQLEQLLKLDLFPKNRI